MRYRIGRLTTFLPAMLLGLAGFTMTDAAPARAAFCVYQYHWGLSWSADSQVLMFHSYEWNPNADRRHDGRADSDLWLLFLEDGSTVQVPRQQTAFREISTGRLFVNSDTGLLTASRPGPGWTTAVPFPALSWCYNPEEDTITGRGVWDGMNHVEVLSSTSAVLLGRAMAEEPYNSMDQTGLNAIQYYDSTRQVLVELALKTGEELMTRSVSRDEVQNRWIRRLQQTRVEPAPRPRDCLPFEVPRHPLEFVAGEIDIIEATKVHPIEPPISPGHTETRELVDLGEGAAIERRGAELWFLAGNGVEQQLQEPESFMDRPARLVEAVRSPDGQWVALVLESNLHLPNPVGGILILEITTAREMALIPWRQKCANEYGE